jgi:hypothetical protein
MFDRVGPLLAMARDDQAQAATDKKGAIARAL